MSLFHSDTGEFENPFDTVISVTDRATVFNRLFLNFKADWKTAFFLMLLLSAGIAVMGLSENSAATVIGAMIIAPLGQLIMAFGASVALGWVNEALAPPLHGEPECAKICLAGSFS